MFAYCLNDPVNKADYIGNKPGDLFDTMDEAALDFAMCYVLTINRGGEVRDEKDNLG